MKDTFKFMWVISLGATLLFATMDSQMMMWFSNGFMWVSLIGIIISSNENENENKL